MGGKKTPTKKGVNQLERRRLVRQGKKTDMHRPDKDRCDKDVDQPIEEGKNREK